MPTIFQLHIVWKSTSNLLSQVESGLKLLFYGGTYKGIYHLLSFDESLLDNINN